MRALVTGITGQDGSCRIPSLQKNTRSLARLLHQRKAPGDNITLLEVDRIDQSSIDNVIRDVSDNLPRCGHEYLLNDFGASVRY